MYIVQYSVKYFVKIRIPECALNIFISSQVLKSVILIQPDVANAVTSCDTILFHGQKTLKN